MGNHSMSRTRFSSGSAVGGGTGWEYSRVSITGICWFFDPGSDPGLDPRFKLDSHPLQVVFERLELFQLIKIQEPLTL